MRPWEDKRAGRCTSGASQTLSASGMREGEGGGKKALLQDGITGARHCFRGKTALELLLPLFPPGGHCSTINRDKGGSAESEQTRIAVPQLPTLPRPPAQAGRTGLRGR